MVRNYIRKTNRSSTPHELIRHGVSEILFAGRSIRSVASEYGINVMTLCRYVKEAQTIGTRDFNIGYKSPHQVFSVEQETILTEYIVKAANIFFGLSPRDVRKLAFECGREFGVDMPESWKANETAGAD